MKKYLSIFLILFAIMTTETGCETNNPDNRGVEQWDAIENQAFLNEEYGFVVSDTQAIFYTFSHSAWVNENNYDKETGHTGNDGEYLTWKIKGNEITIFHKDGSEYKKAVYNPSDDTFLIDGNTYVRLTFLDFINSH